MFLHGMMNDGLINFVKCNGKEAFEYALWYYKISRNAIVTAGRLKQILKDKGYKFYIDSPTNQIFVILDNEKLEQLKKEVVFSFWEKKDEDHTVVRFATSWATQMEDVEKLAALL